MSSEAVGRPTIGVANCGNCRYFLAYEEPAVYKKEGLCRRYPPPEPFGAFPIVYRRDWCGEHREITQ